MKKMIIMAMMMVMTITANAMSYSAAKNEALFLSDKMAYELNLTTAQYKAVYEINLDYLVNLNGHRDVFGVWWDRRNADLRFVLNSWQYDKYVALSHFYRPVAWKAGNWSFVVRTHYAHRPAPAPVAKHRPAPAPVAKHHPAPAPKAHGHSNRSAGHRAHR